MFTGHGQPTQMTSCSAIREERWSLVSRVAPGLSRDSNDRIGMRTPAAGPDKPPHSAQFQAREKYYIRFSR